MSNEMDLMQRLAVSKKIMEKHNEIKRGEVSGSISTVENFEPVSGNYNIPTEMVSESQSFTKKHDPSTPLDENRILNSKLPDEIKRLMIEQPIVQPNTITGGPVLSDEVIEGATRLMKKDNKISDMPQKSTTQQNMSTETFSTSNINVNEIKNMIRNVVRDTVRDVVREELKEAGMIVESTTNSNETIQFKVGNTVFVGKITKVKKLEK